MKRIISLAILLILLVGCTEKQQSFADFRGTQVAFKQNPEKIVVISSALVSILDEMGVQIAGTNSLMANVSYALKNSKDAVNIGSAVDPDFEKIKAIQPDIVIAGSTFAGLADEFTSAQIPLWMVSNQTCDQMMSVIKDFGVAFNKENEADRIVEDFKKRQNSVLSKIEGQTPPKVLIIWGTSDDYLFAKEKSFVGSIVEMLGCHNVVNDATFEDVVPNFMANHDETKMSDINPDIILKIYDGNYDNVWQIFKGIDGKLENEWSHMTAAKTGKVFELRQDFFAANPGITMMDSFEKVAKMLFEE